MELREVCESLVHETEGVRACVVLDLETRLTLTQCLGPGFGPAVVRHAARTAGGIFRGKLLRQFARTLPGDRSASGFVREAQVSTVGAHWFMALLPRFPSALLVCITDKSVNIGMGWMAVHQALDCLREDPPELHAAAGRSDPHPVAEADFRESRLGSAASNAPAAVDPGAQAGRADFAENRPAAPDPSPQAPRGGAGTTTPARRSPASRPRPRAAPAPVAPSISSAAPKAHARKDAAPRNAAAKPNPNAGKLSARGFFTPKPARSKRDNAD